MRKERQTFRQLMLQNFHIALIWISNFLLSSSAGRIRLNEFSSRWTLSFFLLISQGVEPNQIISVIITHRRHPPLFNEHVWIWHEKKFFNRFFSSLTASTFWRKTYFRGVLGILKACGFIVSHFSLLLSVDLLNS